MSSEPVGRLLSPAELDAEQRALYEEFCSGPRVGVERPNGPVDAEGRLVGPFNAMLYRPRVGGPLQRLGAALRYQGTLADTVRELVILRVAGHHDSSYERGAHRKVARRLGIDEETLVAVDLGVPERLPHGVPASARAALELAQLILEGRLSEQAELARLHAVLGDADVFEVSTLVGYYALLATQMTLFGVTFGVTAPAHPEPVEASTDAEGTR